MNELLNTQLKLRDAATQMKLAIKNSSDEDVFRSCINSFINNARSVTFVMQEESGSNEKLKEWYLNKQKELAGIPLLKFFNEQRVFSVHKGVVKPSKEISKVCNQKEVYINVPGQGLVKSYKFTAESKEISYVEGDVISIIRSSNTTICWYFDGIKKYRPEDSGNVLRLCEEYFRLLKSIVTEWLRKKEELESNLSN